MRGLDKSKYHVELACAPNGRLIDWVQSNGMPVRTLKKLKSAGISTGINCVISKKNYQHIREILTFAKSNGVKLALSNNNNASNTNTYQRNPQSQSQSQSQYQQQPRQQPHYAQSSPREPQGHVSGQSYQNLEDFQTVRRRYKKI